MRQPILFIDRGDGWENMTGHHNDAAALSDFTIDWGTDEPTSQPDCNVLKFRMLDRTEMLAGNSYRLAGMKVLIQLSRMPLWRDLNADGRWTDEPPQTVWADFHLENTPSPEAAPDPSALSIFEGNISTGGTIGQRADGTYMLDLYANSRTVRMGRTTRQGPVDNDPKHAGLHWTGTLTQRVDELQRRILALDAPPLATKSMEWLKSLDVELAGYDLSSMPDLSTILYATASWSPEIPLYYERHSHSGSTLEILHAGAPASMTLHSDGTLTVSNGVRTETVITGDKVRVDAAKLSLPDPICQVTIKGRRATWEQSDGRLSFTDAESDVSADGRLPRNLTETVKSATFDTDVILQDDSEGNWGHAPYQPGIAERDQWAGWLQAMTMRLRPEKLTVSTEDIDIDEFEQTFQPSATLWAFVSNRYTRLTADDGTPATSGAWLGIGGTLSFSWHEDTPVLSNEVTLQPLPMTPSTLSSWADLNPIGLLWTAMGFTWGEFSQITYFRK